MLADDGTADAGPVVDLKISVSIADGHGGGQVLAPGEFFAGSGVEFNPSISHGLTIDLDRAVDSSERGKLDVIPHEVVRGIPDQEDGKADSCDGEYESLHHHHQGIFSRGLGGGHVTIDVSEDFPFFLVSGP